MIRFRYKPFRRVMAPIITIGVRIEATWLPIEVYVDSGSLYTILHSEIAEGIGFDYISGERSTSKLETGVLYLFICTSWRYNCGLSGLSERWDFRLSWALPLTYWVERAFLIALKSVSLRAKILLPSSLKNLGMGRCKR